MISLIQAAEISFVHRVAGLSLRNRVRSLSIRHNLEEETLLLSHPKECVEVVQASDSEDSRAPPLDIQIRGDPGVDPELTDGIM